MMKKISKAQRLEMATAFDKVLSKFKAGKGYYICFALESLRDYNIIKRDVYLRCTEYIEKSLGPHSSYEVWMMNNHEEIYNDIIERNYVLVYKLNLGLPEIHGFRTSSRNPFQQGRIQWLKAIVKEFRS